MKAKYIWYDKDGQGRNPFCMFRKVFEVSGGVKEARLNIFADTHYQLFVNGEFVEFGPVRFDPRFPVYDSHDLAGHLKDGKNVIAVLVNYIGHKTFKSIKNRGGMIAWGSIGDGAGNLVNLESQAGSWKALKSEAFSDTTPRLSFALNAQEFFDQSKEQLGWKEIDFDDSHWPEAVEIEAQDSWGPLEPRRIPFMSGKEIPLAKVNHVRPLVKTEDLYSYQISLPYTYSTYAERYVEYSKFYAFYTWVYSPTEKTVTVGMMYEDLWVNGKPAEDKYEDPLKCMRYNARLRLNKGWNYLFGTGGAQQDRLDMYLAFPRGEGLVLSADKTFEPSPVFRHTPNFTQAEYDLYIKDKKIPFDPDDDLKEVGGWLVSGEGQHPCKESSWDTYGDMHRLFTPQDLQGYVFKKSDYPDGFSILVSFEHIHLVFPMIKLSGVKGATIDYLYSDRLQADGQHVRILGWVPLGDRAVCSEDTIEWFPAHPRGFKFLSITIRNTTGDVKLESLKMRSAAYPVVDKGSFRCSDPCLNNIYETGKRTQEANMEDAYVDCIDRERGMYVLDTVIQYLNNLAVFGDQELMRRCMEVYSQSNHERNGLFRAIYPNTGDYYLINFALYAVEGFYHYYMNSGDKDFVKQVWGTITRNLTPFHQLADQREDLLLDAEDPMGEFVENNGYFGAGDNSDNTGINCLYSCHYLLTLQQTLVLAEAIDMKEDARELKRRISILKKTIPETFWLEEAGCLRDSLNSHRISVHSNIYAILTDLLKGKRLEQVKEYLARELSNVFANGYDPSDGAIIRPSSGMYLLSGLYKAELYKTAEGMMKQAWGWFLTQGLRTFPEHFYLDTSNCHAWSASPVYFIPKNVLGINYPKAPNFDQLEIQVKTDGVTWAEGSFPHPRGVIEVKWHTEKDERIFDYIKVPDGVKFTIKE